MASSEISVPDQSMLDGLPGIPCDTFTTACEKASSITYSEKPWINPITGMKLNRDRWLYWGESVPGATGQIDWIWTAGPPAPSAHANHKSAMDCRVLLGEQIDAAAAMGMIEWLPGNIRLEDWVDNVLPLGARVKGPGKVRMLVDPSLPGVNKAMTHLPVRLTSPEQILQHVKPHSVLGKRDLLNGFFHVVCSPSARRAMGLVHPVTGRRGRWVVLPQGTAQSPAIFCAVTDAAARIFNKMFASHNVACTVFVYVDDFILVANSHADMRRAFSLMSHEADRLGLTFNPVKDVGADRPVTSLEALGLIIDAPSLSLSLPSEKRENYLLMVQQFIAEFNGKDRCPRSRLEQLVGKLVFASRACRWGFLFVQGLLDCLFPGFDARFKSVKLDDGCFHDLEFWLEALGPKFDTWMGVKAHMVTCKHLAIAKDLFSMQLFSDASKSFGVGGVLGSEVLSQKWERNVSGEHIGALELEALYHNLVHFRHELHGASVLAWLDNTQAVAAVNKGASRIPALRSTLLNIALLGLEHKFEVKAQYIAGISNPADGPSRGKVPTTSQDYTFMFFEEFNNPPAQVDCCAAESGYNVQPGCTEWFSMQRPLQANVDSMVGKVLWANVPFSHATETIGAIVEAWHRDPVHTVATLVVPEWPTTTWYRRFIRRKKPIFQLLKRYPAGSQLFTFKNSKKPAPPCKFPVLVLRLGGPVDRHMKQAATKRT